MLERMTIESQSASVHVRPEQIIEARWVIPVHPRDTIHEHHAVVIRNGRISELMPINTCRERYPDCTRVTLDEHALLPGLVNAHTHAAMNLLRGYADELALGQWLQEHIWPAESQHVDARFVHDGTSLAIAEMLRGGVTCFNDMYFFPDYAAAAASEAAIRACVGLIVIDFPTAWANDADEYLVKAIAVHDRCRDEPLVSTAFAPHAPYTVSDEPLQRVATLAEELDLPVHIHVHETADEVRRSIAEHGVRPLQRLHRLGLVSPRLAAVHLTCVNDEDIELLAMHGAHALHCPESNLKLASGMCPIERIRQAGINVAIGTDGAASNNDLDMIGEMRTAALLAKGVSGDAAAFPASAVLHAATLGGAKALGMEHEFGSIEVGKSADLCAIDLSALRTQPVFNPLSQVVYAASAQQVSHVWVAGKALLENGELLTIDDHALRANVREWAAKIGMPAVPTQRSVAQSNTSKS
ncbi:MAG: 5-methylthioadenosine/S-adenosylhomocysteine deaminase [Gammaproteobacteria bacterium]|jgi:5-methylthioadenosine/S-adenosylhomocysteine deaminase